MTLATPNTANASRVSEAVTETMIALEGALRKFRSNAEFCASGDPIESMVNHWERSADTVQRVLDTLDHERREIENAAPITIVLDLSKPMVEVPIVPFEIHAGEPCNIMHEAAGAPPFNFSHGRILK